jgi:ribulose kinase
VPPELHERAHALGTGVHEVLEDEAARLQPGESGLLALDWWNGNRSVLVDADLRGLATGREFAVAASSQTPALGSAMFGAVAAGAERGGHDSIVDASSRMAHLLPQTYRPLAAYRAVYDRLYPEYVRLYDLFGRGGDDVMRTLKRIQRDA